jgi:RNA polymerase sigma-70 factor (ECF subfamily)
MGDQPETSDELELVAAVSAGSTDALATLYDRYSKTLMSLGMRVLKDVAEVEDLLHDVFVEVWEKAGSYDPARGSVRTWLCLRMRSRALDRCKLARRRRVDQLDDPDSPVNGQGSAILAESAPEVLGRDKLHEAINDLPDPQQMVISLAYFQGLSCSEIAASLEVPIGTVKSRLAGAKRGLQRAMGETAEGAT